MSDPLHDPDRRRLLQTGTLVLLIGAPYLAHAGRVVAVRIWPAQDYTRVTIESDGELKAQKTTVDQAHRLVVDIGDLRTLRQKPEADHLAFNF